MQKIIEDVLNVNKITYLFYTKPLTTTAQTKKFIELRKKKHKHVFIVERVPKIEVFFRACMEEHGLEGMEGLKYAIFRGETVYLASENISEQDLREEMYDDIVNSSELFACEECKDIIRSQKMKCASCEEPSYLCTLCFSKIIMACSGSALCPKCNRAFLDFQAKLFLDEMLDLYKSDPRNLFTLLQKKKKHLPPSLKNLTNILHSAMGEAKSKGEKFDFQ